MAASTYSQLNGPTEPFIAWPAQGVCVNTVATNALNTAVVTGVTGMTLALLHYQVSFAAVSGAATVIQVLDGTNVIWQQQVNVVDQLYDFNCEKHPLTASKSASLSVTCGAIGGTTPCTISFSFTRVKAS